MKIFYCDYGTGKDVEAENPLSVSPEEALDLFADLSPCEGSFFGVIDTEDRTIQFMWNEDMTLHLDIPQPENNGSLTGTVSFEDAETIILDISKGKDPATIGGLVFLPW
ncbi:MAG: hypothetical protein M3O22_08410 [Pseudomonadota bacterium]|nr:hypothetical protein [Pseudomonadota bacterium]